jgi:LacI family transcriptional regulator
MKTGASMETIARECGVSPMTVSRALCNSGSVKADTRERILTAAQTLGYLRRGRTGRPGKTRSPARLAVEVVMGGVGRTPPLFYTELLTGIERELAGRGYDCIVRTYSPDYRGFLSLVGSLRSSSADGTILIGDFSKAHLRSLLDVAPDALLVDNPGDADMDFPLQSVGFDNQEAARLGVHHLIARGCRRILLVRGTPENYFSREIEEGYREALRTADRPFEADLVLDTDFSADDAFVKVSEALEKGLTFDGVFTNDEMACGIYRALHQYGKRIPEDVALCGCDGIPVGRQLIPPLTTVVLDYGRLGRLAVEHLLAENRRLFTDSRIQLRPRLEVRQSS